MSSDSKADTVSRLLELTWHEDELSVADEVLAPEFVGHTPGLPTARGPDGFKGFVHDVKAAFPDCRHPVDDIVAGDYSVAVRWRFIGTHEGEFLGVEPTGREVEITGLEQFRFEDGRIVESWASPDMLGLVRQLGVDDVESLELPE